MLAPWELLFLEIVPEEFLQEPVAIVRDGTTTAARRAWWRTGRPTQCNGSNPMARAQHPLSYRDRRFSSGTNREPGCPPAAAENEWFTMKSGPVPSTHSRLNRGEYPERRGRRKTAAVGRVPRNVITGPAAVRLG